MLWYKQDSQLRMLVCTIPQPGQKCIAIPYLTILLKVVFAKFDER